MTDKIKMVAFCIVSTRVGWILIAESTEGICLLEFLGKEQPDGTAALDAIRRAFPKIDLAATARVTPLLEKATRAVHDYLKDGVPLPDLPLDLQNGTAFQQQVWTALRRIPFGETRSYGQIAREIDNPEAARAVGHACGSNPVPLFVPCHRVLGSGGALGGFSAGLHVKEALLSLERAHSQGDAESSF